MALLLCSGALFGQSTFHKQFQGGAFFCTTPLSPGGVLGTGYTYSNAGTHGLLVRFDNQGEVFWQRQFPTTTFIQHAVQTEGGYLIVGDTVDRDAPFPQPVKSIVSKVDESGNVEWNKILGNDESVSILNRVMVVPNGYIVSGFLSALDSLNKSATIISKLDENGETLWSKSYLSTHPTYFLRFGAQLLQGDTLYACGLIQGNGCLVRININTGELLGWSSFGGLYYEVFNNIKPTADGNFILAGSTRSTTDSEEDRPWVMKINRMGQVLWSKTYNIPGTLFSAFVENANDGNFLVSFAPGHEGIVTGIGILIKIDASGNLIWTYNYASGSGYTLNEITRSADGGFLAGGGQVMLQTDPDGRVSNGCCPGPLNLTVENYVPSVQNPMLSSKDWEETRPFLMHSVADTLFNSKNVCETEITNIIEQIQVCQGDSILINGRFYKAPNTVKDTVQNLSGGCDTVYVYNLLAIPLPTKVQTLSLCPGKSVLFEGIIYTQPTTIRQTIPATTGCDTLFVTFIEERPFIKKFQTTTFCPGETVFIDGVGYQFPGTLPFPDTLLGSATSCDTLLYQVLAYPSTPSSITLHCPPNLEVMTSPSTPVAVDFALATASTDCTCPDLYVGQFQGPSSGAIFPVGSTQVCYEAFNVCGAYKTCCFDVNVQEEEACDVKLTGCVRYELLGISTDATQNKTYRLRVTNDCASALSYTAIQVPNGVEAISPVQNSIYSAPSGRDYSVRNPNHSPFKSIRFKPLGTGISGGASDVFEFTLPTQSSPTFIKAATRLASGAWYEVTLNTFDCVVSPGSLEERGALRGNTSPDVRVFPNPSSGELFLDFSTWESETAQARVLNTQGQELLQTILLIDKNIQVLPIPERWADGLYFLEITSADGRNMSTRFVLHR